MPNGLKSVIEEFFQIIVACTKKIVESIDIKSNFEARIMKKLFFVPFEHQFSNI